MSDDLVFDSPEGSKLFLVALREFSENCKPPELIAECPFSIQAEPGVRSCGEECMDILGANKAPDAVAEVDLGGGLTVQRTVVPRSRRGSDGPSRAFDAKEIYQEDSGNGEPPRWRLTSLIYGLGDLVTTAPPVDSDVAETRLSRIAELTDLIESRGLDVEKHLEHWLRRKAVGSLMSALRRPVLWQESPEFGHGVEWVDLLAGDVDGSLEGDDDETVARRKALNQTALRTVITWAQGASRDDLVGWNPPDHVADDFPSRDEDEFDVEEGQWMVDRFHTTYISDWDDVSLRQEWQYLHGRLMPPCPSTEMSVRVIAEDEIAPVMAERMANRELVDRTRSVVPNLVETVAEFLEEGRRTEAAAIFEALQRRYPSDAETHNNLGFCLLPDQPARAVELFERAMELDPVLDLSKMNRVLALTLLGKRGEAIDSAIRLREEAGSRFLNNKGWLWNVESVLSESEPFIDKEVNFGSYLEELVHILEGDQERGPAS